MKTGQWYLQKSVWYLRGLSIAEIARQALQRGLQSRTSFGCGNVLRARDPTFRPQNWEAPGRAHSVHPARVLSGRSSFTLSSVSGLMPPPKEWVGGQNTASRRELRRQRGLQKRFLDAEMRFERVIRRSAPKTGRHWAGRTTYTRRPPPSTPCRLS